jgi:hypothetical protein
MDDLTIRPTRPIVTRTFVTFVEEDKDKALVWQPKDCIIWNPRELHEFLTSKKIDVENETDV